MLYVKPLLIFLGLWLHVDSDPIPYIGLNFSPYVLASPVTPDNSAYTLEVVKFQLNLLIDSGYRLVNTDNMGVQVNSTTGLPSDIKLAIYQTAIAAAQINNASQSLLIEVMVGIRYWDTAAMQTAEIQAAVDVITVVNSIYPGTVTKYILTSGYIVDPQTADNVAVLLVQASSLFFPTLGNSIATGVRMNCSDYVRHTTTDYTYPLQDILVEVSFLMCDIDPAQYLQTIPYPPYLQFDAPSMASMVMAECQNLISILSFENIMMVSGWSSTFGPFVDQQNPLHNDLNLGQYWTEMSIQQGGSPTPVFMDEAFDNPWRNNVAGAAPGAGSFGRWHVDDYYGYYNKFE